MDRVRLTAGAMVFCLLGWPCWPQSQAAYRAAASHVRQGRFELAIPLLEKILAGAPQDLKARNLLGIALLSAGRRQEADAQFRKALATDRSFYPALKNLAVNELALGLQKEAKAHFEEVLKLVPKDPVAHLNLGEICFAERRYAQAAAHYERSAGLHLKDPQVTLRYARSAMESKHYAAAVQALEQLAAQGYRKAELYSLLSQAYEHSGRTQQAYDALRSATEIDPQDETNYLELMSLCLEHNTWDLALEISDVALARIPQAYRVRLQRGAVLALKGQLEEAENEFSTATRVAPQASLPYVALALVRIQTGRLPEAIEALRLGRAQNPKDYVANWTLGEALSRQGLLPGTEAEKEAVQALEDAVRENPRAAPPRVLLGKLLAKRGELTRAAREFEEALKVDPDDVSASYQLALVYRQTGNAKRADELFAKVGKARSVDPERLPQRDLVKIIREGAR